MIDPDRPVARVCPSAVGRGAARWWRIAVLVWFESTFRWDLQCRNPATGLRAFPPNAHSEWLDQCFPRHRQASAVFPPSRNLTSILHQWVFGDLWSNGGIYVSDECGEENSRFAPWRYLVH